MLLFVPDPQKKVAHNQYQKHKN